MDKNSFWQLFKETGKIKYYLKYKELEKEAVDKNDKKG